MNASACGVEESSLAVVVDIIGSRAVLQQEEHCKQKKDKQRR
jgi:hypothetical protein